MGYIVRNGRGSAWTYQIVASGNGKLNFDLKCDTTTFRGATAHVENKCWFTPLPFSTFYNNVGSWDLATANCVPVDSTGFASFKYTTGLQRSVAEANSNTYTDCIRERCAAARDEGCLFGDDHARVFAVCGDHGDDHGNVDRDLHAGTLVEYEPRCWWWQVRLHLELDC
jgi:hypothetical protein